MVEWGSSALFVYFFCFLFLCDLERFGGVRQCWEQERTTCSGGYPSATCSAFLHYCDGGIIVFTIVNSIFINVWWRLVMLCISMSIMMYCCNS
jgi:hypothetical protein